MSVWRRSCNAGAWNRAEGPVSVCPVAMQRMPGLSLKRVFLRAWWFHARFLCAAAEVLFEMEE